MLDAGEVPVSASPDRRDLEGVFLELWASGRNTSIAGARRELEQRAQGGGTTTAVLDAGGHGDVPHGDSDEHGDAPHGDRPHGDA